VSARATNRSDKPAAYLDPSAAQHNTPHAAQLCLVRFASGMETERRVKHQSWHQPRRAERDGMRALPSPTDVSRKSPSTSTPRIHVGYLFLFLLAEREGTSNKWMSHRVGVADWGVVARGCAFPPTRRAFCLLSSHLNLQRHPARSQARPCQQVPFSSWGLCRSWLVQTDYKGATARFRLCTPRLLAIKRDH
jgi:hypothetical protein